MGVSVPVAWEELVELRGGDHWTVRTLPQRLDDLKDHDPWAAYEKSRQTLTQASRMLQEDLPALGDEDEAQPLPPPRQRTAQAPRASRSK
jgi:bifunctional non-homologous end joining protein LigD